MEAAHIGSKPEGATVAIQSAPPRVADHFPPHRLLDDLVTRALDAPCRLPTLTWLCAMPGSGKTLLLSQLFKQLQQAGHQAIWIGLCRQDTPAGPIGSLLAAGPPCPGKPRFILIDNLDFCAEAASGGFIDDLLASLAPQDRLIVTSSGRLAFTEVELRIRDQLLYLDDPSFILDRADTEAMLSCAVRERIGSRGVAQIVSASGGWMIAARLICLRLEQSACPELVLDGPDRLADDLDSWLDHNLLNLFSLPERHLLYQLAEFRSFDMAQAAWILNDPEIRPVLEAIVARMPGVLGQDERMSLREPLRSHLAKRLALLLAAPARRDIRQRLIQWSISFEHWQDGLHYALEAGEMERLATVLERGGETLVLHQGCTESYVAATETLLKAGHRLPDSVIRLYVFCQTFRLHDIHRANWFDGSGLERDDCGEDEGPEAICRLFWGNDDGLEAAIARWLAACESRSAFEIVWVRQIQAAALMRGYQFAKARAALTETLPLLDKLRLPLLNALDDMIHCALLLYEGNYREADRRASLAGEHARHLLSDEAIVSDVFATFCAKCAIESGNDDRARALLPRIMRQLGRHESIGASACAIDVALHLWDGTSGDVLAEIRRAVGVHVPRLSATFDCYLTRRLLRQGDIAGALRQATLIGLDPARATLILPSGTSAHDEQNLIVMTSLELLIAMDDWVSALPLLRAHQDSARRSGRTGRLVQYELIEMLHAVSKGDTQQANRLLISAIRHAHSREIWRPFLEYRDTLAGLSNRAPIGVAWFTVRSEQEFFVQLVERLGLATSGGRIPPVDMTAETLTTSEKHILQMVGQGLSNPQIARLEGISQKTVKWHLRNIFRKLGATNRTMALRFAREAGVVEL